MYYTLDQIYAIEDDDKRNEAREQYEKIRMSCYQDSLGQRCNKCPLKGTTNCHDPKKAALNAWKWTSV